MNDPNYPPNPGQPNAGQPNSGQPNAGQPNSGGYPPYPPPPGYGPGASYDPNYPPGQGNPYAPPPPFPGSPYGAPPRKGSAAPWIIGGCVGLLVLVVAAIGLLAWIGSRHPSAANTGGGPTTTAASAPTATDSATAGASTGAADAKAQEMVAQLTPILPLNVADVVVSSVTAQGGAIQMTGTVNVDTTQTGWDEIGAGVRRDLCANGYDQLTNLGGVVQVGITDTAGNGSTQFFRRC